MLNRLLALGLAALCTIGVSDEAKAWGKNGHMVVCDLAYRNFTAESRDQLKVLFELDRNAADSDRRVYTSFNYACLEEDEFPRQNPDEHFLNVPRSLRTWNSANCPANVSTCVLNGIDRQKEILANRQAPAQARARALMSIGHWVGDIHQPLHVSFSDDRGGNSIDVTGACGSGKFHAVWDNCIVERRLLTRIQRQRNWSRFTPTYRLVDSFRAMESRDGAQIRRWIASDPGQWAAESYAIALAPEVLYCFQRADGCWYSSDHLTYVRRDGKRKQEISNEYLDEFEPVVEQRIRQAGYRLAHIVNMSLDPTYKRNYRPAP